MSEISSINPLTLPQPFIPAFKVEIPLKGTPGGILIKIQMLFYLN